MATKRKTPTISDELHRMVTELHSHSVETRMLIAGVVERLDKVEKTVASQGNTLSWYEFVIKAAKGIGAVALVILTLRFGDVVSVFKTTVLK